MIFTMMLGIVEFASIGIGNYFKAFANRHQDITKGFGLKIQNHYSNNTYKKAYRVLIEILSIDFEPTKNTTLGLLLFTTLTTKKLRLRWMSSEMSYLNIWVVSLFQ